MEVSLKKIARSDKETIKHLWDLYSYDFSVYNDEDVQTDGEYDFYYKDEYFDSKDKSCYFIMVDDKYAGFVSISNICYTLTRMEDRCIVDFFVMKKYRQGGVGRKAAYKLFDMFPERWEVAQYDNNDVSKIFWEKIIADYTASNYQIRTVVQQDYTLQAIIFDAGQNKDESSLQRALKNIDDVYHIDLYSRPCEDIKNHMIKLAISAYPQYENFYKNIRRDLSYQDILTIGTKKETFGFLMFTSIDGNMEITFAVIRPSKQKQGFCKRLLASLKQHAKQNGFEKIVVDFDTNERAEQMKPLYDFYIKNGFCAAEQRFEMLEYVL